MQKIRKFLGLVKGWADVRPLLVLSLFPEPDGQNFRSVGRSEKKKYLPKKSSKKFTIQERGYDRHLILYERIHVIHVYTGVSAWGKVYRKKNKVNEKSVRGPI